MDELEARIDALERAVTDGDHDLSELATEGETRERLAAVETEVEDLVDRVAELEAATQALRGYVGNVRAVNRETEQRAEAALAKAESVESAIVGDRSGDRPGRNRRETPAGSGDHGVETNGRSPEGAGQQTDRTRERDRSASTGRRSTGSGGESHDRGGRCAACGQPTENADSNRRGFEESNRTPTGGAGVSDAATGGVGDTSASGTGVGKPGEQRAGDQLDGVFEADEPESGDNGAFDRIREML